MQNPDAIQNLALEENWTLFRLLAGTANDPSQIEPGIAVEGATVPGTVAESYSAFCEKNSYKFESYDDYDWWYQCRFDAKIDSSGAYQLCFDGLATIAEVWLNGRKILTSRNMFRRFRVDVTELLKQSNTLTLVFRSITNELRIKKPRPRWKTKLVSEQQLRWIRTTLLGRIPGWTPPQQPVGPWHGIRLESSPHLFVSKSAIAPSIQNDVCRLNINLQLDKCRSDVEISSLTLSILGKTLPLTVKDDTSSFVVDEVVELVDAPRWNPHTEGNPTLHDYSISVISDFGALRIVSGQVGFRDIKLDRENSIVRLLVNDNPLFCRGSCWTVGDLKTLGKDLQSIRVSLELMRDAGANMIRIGGTMLYERDEFYQLCDELGIMIWQDFMFANMDYPIDDADFAEDVTKEVEEQSERLLAYASVVVFCGNSEVEQQACMFGRTKDIWTSRLFYDVIPSVLKQAGSMVPYFPSSPCEGTLPFENATGISHYFGVGAYKRSLDDLVNSKIRFTTECLGFSNVPSDATLIARFGTSTPAPHDPAWKSGIPRDSGAGWDFEDIRDHYAATLYGIDPVELRSIDNAQYMSIAKVVPGELMLAAYNYWMHSSDECGGALSWFLKDIVPGAGWGLIDSDNLPKPVYYFLKRAWQAGGISFIDRGLSGLEIALRNPLNTAQDIEVEVRLIQSDRSEVARASTNLQLKASSAQTIALNHIFGCFHDSTYAYKFGPPQYDLVVAFARNVHFSADAFFFPTGRRLPKLNDADVRMSLNQSHGHMQLSILSDRFLQNVEIDAGTHLLSDNFFHLPPNVEKVVHIQLDTNVSKPFRCVVSALNISKKYSLQ